MCQLPTQPTATLRIFLAQWKEETLRSSLLYSCFSGSGLHVFSGCFLGMHTWHYHFMVLLSISRSLLHCPSSQKATVIHPKVSQGKPKSLLCCHIQQTLLGISRPSEVLGRQLPGTHTHAQKLKSYLPCPRWPGFSLLSANRHHKVSRVSTEARPEERGYRWQSGKSTKALYLLTYLCKRQGTFWWQVSTRRRNTHHFQHKCLFRSFFKKIHMGSTLVTLNYSLLKAFS